MTLAVTVAVGVSEGDPLGLADMEGVTEGEPLTLTVVVCVAEGVPVGLAFCDCDDDGVSVPLGVSLELSVVVGVRVCGGEPLALTVVEGVAEGVDEPVRVLVGVLLGDCEAVRLGDAVPESGLAASVAVAVVTTTEAMSTEPATSEGGMPAPAANAALKSGDTGWPSPYDCSRSVAVPASPTTATQMAEPSYVVSASARAALSLSALAAAPSLSARAAALGKPSAEKGPPPTKGVVEPGAATNVMYTLDAGTRRVAATCSRSAATATADVAEETMVGAESAVA